MLASNPEPRGLFLFKTDFPSPFVDQDAVSPPTFLSFVLFLSEEADRLTQRSVNQKTFHTIHWGKRELKLMVRISVDLELDSPGIVG